MNGRRIGCQPEVPGKWDVDDRGIESYMKRRTEQESCSEPRYVKEHDTDSDTR